jgi:hypothetical protein
MISIENNLETALDTLMSDKFLQVGSGKLQAATIIGDHHHGFRLTRVVAPVLVSGNMQAEGHFLHTRIP